MSERIEVMLLKKEIYVRCWVAGDPLISWRSFSAPTAGDFVGYNMDTYVIDDVCWVPNDEMGLESVQVNMTLQD